MNDRLKNWLLGLLGAACIAAGGSAMKMRDDVRDMKRDSENTAKSDQVAELKSSIAADKAISEIRLQAFNERIGDLSGRVRDLEKK